MSVFPSLTSLEGGVPISLDKVPGVPLEWGPPWTSLLSSLSSLADTWYGVGASILVNTGSAESSGRGDEHLILSPFFIQPWPSMVFSEYYYGKLN